MFEGIRSYAGKVFRLAEHLDRLWDSAKAIWLEIPMTERGDGQGDRGHAGRQRHPGRLHPPGGDPRRRHAGARSQPAAAHPQVIIIADKIALYPAELYEKGLEIVTVSVLRNHPAALSPRIKSLNYLNNILAKIEGIQAGCVEALMLNHKGEVAECTGDNIFLVRKGGC